MITAALGFLTSPIGRGTAAALGALALLVGLYSVGHHNGVMGERGVWQKKADDAATAAREIEAKGGIISAGLQASHEAETTKIEYRTKTLIQRIPEYVPHAVDCPVNAGAVSVFNAAVVGSEIPAASGGPVEAPSGLTLSDLTAAAVYNLGVANQALDEAQTWRTWYAEQAKLRGAVTPQ